MASDPEGGGTLEARLPATAAEEPRPVPRRRRAFFLVSVRGLLVLILIIGCALGLIARIARTGALQHRAVAAIYQAGGWVVYDTEWDQRVNTSAWTPRWPKWLVDRVGVDYLGNVVFVNLHDRGTDQVLAQVGRLRHLKQLHRPGFAVTDRGLAHLGQLSDLQFLSLDDTQVTDAGLASLTALKNLKWLKLTRTKVTDRGVTELRKFLPQLQAIR
jgi:hypothetical protein